MLLVQQVSPLSNHADPRYRHCKISNYMPSINSVSLKCFLFHSYSIFFSSSYHQTLQKEAERRKPQLASMAENHQQLVKLNPELTATAEVDLKLESVRSPYDDWCRKLGMWLSPGFNQKAYCHSHKSQSLHL